MTPIWRLRAAVLTLLGALVVHRGRYAFATAEHEHHLSAAHTYLAWLGPLVSVVAFLAVVQLLAGLGRRDPEAVPELPGLRRLWPCASLILLAIFGAQESLETLFAHGHLPGGLELLGNGGWTAIPIAAAAGAAIALLLRGAERVVRWALARTTRPRRSPPRILAPPPVLLVALGSVIARRLAGRAPPRPSSTP